MKVTINGAKIFPKNQISYKFISISSSNVLQSVANEAGVSITCKHDLLMWPKNLSQGTSLYKTKHHAPITITKVWVKDLKTSVLLFAWKREQNTSPSTAMVRIVSPIKDVYAGVTSWKGKLATKCIGVTTTFTRLVSNSKW